MPPRGHPILREGGPLLNDQAAGRAARRRSTITPPRAQKAHIAIVAGSGVATTSSPSTLVPSGFRSSAPTPAVEVLPLRVPYWLARSNCVACGPNCVFGSANVDQVALAAST